MRPLPFVHLGPGGAPPAQEPAGERPSTPASPESASNAGPPPGAGFMNVARWVLFVGLLALAGIALAGTFRGCSPAGRRGATAAADVYYCPMHPSITSDRPGECPICGMNLEKREPGGGATGAARGNVPQLTVVHLTPERIQMIGVRTVVARPGGMAPERELTGFVAPDDQRLERIQIRVAGWIQDLPTGREGDFVERGTPLLTLQSPELYQNESEFLIALEGQEAGAHEHDRELLEAARSRLRLLAIPGEEIERLERTRLASQRLTLHSPVSGTVLERSVLAGQYVGPDTPLLTIADLSRVWVLVDLYERDLPLVRPGSRAQFVTDALPGRAIEGAVEFVYPTVDPATRTAKARLVLDNRDRALRPGMFGTVRVRGTASGARIVLPSEAVVNTGSQRYVFLAHGGGRFEPRRVVVGREEGDAVEVLSGVAPGDTVVASGTFLIDSESRLEAALSGMGGAAPAAGDADAADPHRGHR